MQTMKKLLIFTCFVGSMAAGYAQNNSVTTASLSSPKQELLTLKEAAYNFGKIPQGRPAVHIFEVINTGKDSLKLDNVQASCGCTTPEWSREAIAPGAASNIKVGYNAYAEGAFTKIVTIYYKGDQTKTLTISGEVYKSPAISAPENSSVQFLKQTNQ
jgi:Protein of unknown function (DUF1573)